MASMAPASLQPAAARLAMRPVEARMCTSLAEVIVDSPETEVSPASGRTFDIGGGCTRSAFQCDRKRLKNTQTQMKCQKLL